VTEDALSCRPDLEHTTNPDDILSLPDPDDFGLPQPTGTAPASSLAAPFLPPSHVRPPMDDDGVLVLEESHTTLPLAAFPYKDLPDDDLITCSMSHAPATNPALASVPNGFGWRSRLVSFLRSLGPSNATRTPPLSALDPSGPIGLNQILPPTGDHSNHAAAPDPAPSRVASRSECPPQHQCCLHPDPSDIVDGTSLPTARPCKKCWTTHSSVPRIWT